MNEAQVQANILKYLRKTYAGAVVWKLTEQSLCGVPDIFFAWGGKVFFFEVKCPGGRRRPRQVFTVSKLNKNGVPSAFVESLDDVKVFLQKIC
jgi:hypothetical protein